MHGLLDFTKQCKPFVFLLLLFAVSAGCQTYQINRDENGLHTFGPVMQSVIARNLLEYGPQKTHFATACNLNPLTGEFTYYLYHPSLLPAYVYAAAYKVFGFSILSGRLISMFIFYLGAFIFYLLVWKLFSATLAFWASTFYVFFPINQYLGKFVGSPVITLFMLLFILFYFRWVQDRKPRFLYLTLASFILASACDWHGFFLAPFSAFHYYLILKKKDPSILSIAAAAIAMLLAYFAFSYYLTGNLLAGQSQWPKLFNNIENYGETANMFEHLRATRMHFGLFLQTDFYSRIFSYLLTSFTLPVMAVVTFFVFNRVKYARYRPKLAYFLFIAATYFFYGIPQPKTLYDHFFWVLVFSPYFAVISAIAFTELKAAARMVFAIIFILFSISNLNEFYSANNSNQDHIRIGKILPLISQKNDGVALSEPFFSPFIEYYGNRMILYDVNSWEKLNYTINSKKINLFITNFKNFQSYLINQHPAIFLPDDYVVFDFKGRQSLPTRALPRQIRFSNGVDLSNWSAVRLSQQYYRLEYAWQIESLPREPFIVFVHFDDEKGYKFGQDHYLMNGLIRQVSVGQTFKERYIIEIPENLRGKKLSLFVGLYSPVTLERFKTLNYPTKDNRVYLGAL